MTDAETRAVQECVESFLNSQEARQFDIGNPSHLASLVNHARPEPSTVAEDDLWVVVTMCWLGPHFADIPPTTIRDDLLGIIRRHVLAKGERLERVMEFAIAYGCGKWREVQPGYGGWEQRWQGAVRGLVRVLEPAVAQANRWLAGHVVGFPQNRGISQDMDFPEDTAVWSDAWLLATELVRPEYFLRAEDEERLTIVCAQEETDAGQSTGTLFKALIQDYEKVAPPGAKAVWTIQQGHGTVTLPTGPPLALTTGMTVLIIARDEDAIIKTTGDRPGWQARLKVGQDTSITGSMTLAVWECTCGTTHCRERHRLDAWNPTQIVQKAVTEDGHRKREDTSLTLWDFVASAVKGPQPRIQTGSFVQGIYFPLLAQEGCDQ